MSIHRAAHAACCAPAPARRTPPARHASRRCSSRRSEARSSPINSPTHPATITMTPTITKTPVTTHPLACADAVNATPDCPRRIAIGPPPWRVEWRAGSATVGQVPSVGNSLRSDPARSAVAKATPVCNRRICVCPSDGADNYLADVLRCGEPGTWKSRTWRVSATSPIYALAMTVQPPPLPPPFPGWWPDPDRSAGWRYWDGARWIDPPPSGDRDSVYMAGTDHGPRRLARDERADLLDAAVDYAVHNRFGQRIRRGRDLRPYQLPAREPSLVRSAKAFCSQDATRSPSVETFYQLSVFGA